MTERGLPIADGAPACPFVAFEDDRDERAASPDHRHRCYAEARPAPRALAHQEAYCLSSAFPVCPTFQDWARREAARSRADGPRQSESATEDASDQPRRNPPRNWSAPPPWSPPRAEGDEVDDDEEAWAAAAAAAAAGGAGGVPEDDVPRRGRGLSGSFADRVASGTSEAELGSLEIGEDDEESPAAEQAAAGVAATVPRHRERDGGHVAAVAGADDHPASSPARHERRRDSEAPEWERSRPLEVYPTLRSRRLSELSVPPLLVAVVALALAAAVLFSLPGLLGFGTPSALSSPSPSVAASAATQSSAPTVIPEATPVIYVVRSGDTMSKIAKKFNVPLDELIAANAETIPDPDKLQIGDQVTIPVPASNEPAGSVAPTPS